MNLNKIAKILNDSFPGKSERILAEIAMDDNAYIMLVKLLEIKLKRLELEKRVERLEQKEK